MILRPRTQHTKDIARTQWPLPTDTIRRGNFSRAGCSVFGNTVTRQPVMCGTMQQRMKTQSGMKMKFFMSVMTMFFWNVVAFSQAPSISSLSATTARPGESITISGNGFNATANQNVVWFGGVKGGVNSATSSRLEVIVPAGANHDFIYVTNLQTGLTAHSRTKFIPRFDASESFALNKFSTSATFATGAYPTAFTIADLNGDGKPEAAFINNVDNTISIFRNEFNPNNSGSPIFVKVIDIAVGQGVFDITSADIDGDGRLDLVVAERLDNKISILKNLSTEGSISFAQKVSFEAEQDNRRVAVIDFDGDGKPDIVCSNHNSNTISIFRNIGQQGTINTNSFGSPITRGTQTNPGWVDVADFDGDGRADIAVTNGNSFSVSLYRNLSTSSNFDFSNQTTLAAGWGPASLASGDIDGDGKTDLGVSNYSGKSFMLNRNNGESGTISFIRQSDIGIPGNPVRIALGDINGDGKLDVAVVNGTETGLSMYLNNSASGTIGLLERINFPMPSNSEYFGFHDVNLDGKADVIVSDGTNNTFTVYFNGILGTEEISSFSPASAAPGARITVTGSGFGTTVGRLLLGSTVATGTDLAVLNWSNNRIEAEIPPSMALGSFPLHVVTSARTITSSTTFSVTAPPSPTPPTVSLQWTAAQNASGLLGQTAYTATNLGFSSSKFNSPSGIAIDPVTGTVFIADANNNRVLRFASLASWTDGMAAESVFGQTGFNSTTAGTANNRLRTPSTVFVDANGTLWIADAGNHRVIKVLNAGTRALNPTFDGVLGQPDFVTQASGLSASKMSSPRGLVMDRFGSLYVSDAANNRILRFANAATKADGAAADVVMGQTTFTTNTTAPTDSTFSAPRGLVLDANGDLYVADEQNHRVLRFPNPSLRNTGFKANMVFGQATFNTNTSGNAMNKMTLPRDVKLDRTGRLYVVEGGNNRVSIYSDISEIAVGAAHSISLGTGTAGAGQNGLNSPFYASIDINTRSLLVSDANNHRVLRFTTAQQLDAPPATPVGLSVLAADSLVTLRWSTNNDVDFVRYRIYGGLSANPTTRIDSTTAYVTGQTFRRISGLSNNARYFFRITAVDERGLESAFSAEVTATPQAAKPGELDQRFWLDGGFNGPVYAVQSLSDGKILVGGDFTRYRDADAPRVIRLLSDGTPDVTFVPGVGANGAIRSLLELPDGDVLLGGAFTSFGGRASARIVRLNSDGSVDAGFTSGGATNGEVTVLRLLPNGRILVGGSFTGFSGFPSRLVRIQPGGTLDTSFSNGLAGPNGSVFAAEVLPDGKIVVGGSFTSMHGVNRGGIARLFEDGRLDTSFNPGTGANGDVKALAVLPDQSIIVGGAFTQFASVNARYLARLTTSGALDATFAGASLFNATVSSLAASHNGSGFFTAGAFTTVTGSTTRYVARLTNAGAVDAGFEHGSGASGPIHALDLTLFGRLLAGGDLTGYRGFSTPGLAQIATTDSPRPLVLAGTLDLRRPYQTGVFRAGDSLFVLASEGLSGRNQVSAATYVLTLTDTSFYAFRWNARSSPTGSTLAYRFAVRNRSRTHTFADASGLISETRPGTGTNGARVLALAGRPQQTNTAALVWNNNSRAISAAPRIQTPAAFAEDVHFPVTLSWLTEDFATGYEVHLSDYQAFTGTQVVTLSRSEILAGTAPLGAVLQGDTLRVTLDNDRLMPGATVWWRVQSLYETPDGITASSQTTRSFTTPATLQMNAKAIAAFRLDDTLDDVYGTVSATSRDAVTTSDRFGFAGFAMNLNGTTAHLEVPETPFTGHPSQTISMWINSREATATNQPLFSAGGTTFFLNNRALGYSFRNASNTVRTASTTPLVSVGEWMHTAVTVRRRADSTLVTFYLNGSPVLRRAVSGLPAFSSGQTAFIGAENTGEGTTKRYFNGAIDDLRFYRRAVSDAEIAAVYAEEVESRHVYVWPGDTNVDGVVTAADLIPIARFYGEKSPNRAAGLAWNATVRLRWSVDGSTAKRAHADTDGDGEIQGADVLALGANYAKDINTPDGVTKRMATDTVRLVATWYQEGNAVRLQLRYDDHNRVFVQGVALSLSHPGWHNAVADEAPLVAKRNPAFSEALELVRLLPEQQRWDAVLALPRGKPAPTQGALADWTLPALVASPDSLPKLAHITVTGSQGEPVPASLRFEYQITTASEEKPLPTVFALKANYPNPFNPSTVLAFDLPEAAEVQLEIVDLQGRRIAMPVQGRLAAGAYERRIDMRNAASGVYLYRITAKTASGNAFTQTRKMILLK